MTDAADATPRPDAAARTDSLGVVDPMRIPIPGWLAGWWGRMPVTGRIFVGLAALDVVGRLTGLTEPRYALDFGNPWSFVVPFLPRELLILLPALVLGRRPDAEVATPLVIRGAILVAVVEFVTPQVTTYITVVPDTIAVLIAVTVITVALKAAAWIAIGIGLAALVPREPSPVVGGAANLAAAMIGGWALVQLVLTLASPAVDVGNPELNTASLVTSTVLVVEALAWAFLARVVIRGAEDSRRPPEATRLAVAAFAAVAIVAATNLLLGTLVLVRTAFGLAFLPSPAQLDPATVGFLGWLGGGLATSVVLVAFALGLADTSVRIRAGAVRPIGPTQEPEPVRWPDFGAELPAFRAVPPPPPSQQSPVSPPVRRRRRRSKEPNT